MKKYLYSLLIIGYFLSISLSSYSQTPLSRQVAKPKGTTSLPYGFLEYVPSNYATVDKHPVVIFLHGVGEAGDGNTNLSRLAKHGPFKLIKEGWDLKFIAFAPQETEGLWEDSIAIKKIVLWVIGNYKVDPAKVYVTGISSGGWGSWRAGAIAPAYISAIVPISGCGYVPQAANFKYIWAKAYHNQGDLSVPIQCAKDMVAAVKAASPTGTPGKSAELVIYPVSGHDAFTPTYYDNNMWNWLLSKTKTGTIPVVNKYPIVNAGADKVISLPTNSATFTGTASDPNGTIASYSWSKVSGPAATLSGTTTTTLTATGLVRGTYIFRLKATDNNGAYTLDDVKLIVNNPPTVSAGVDKALTLPTNSLQITATASDVDGTIASYAWTKVSGPTCTMTNTTTKVVTVANLVAGTYFFRVTVKDNHGASKSDDVKVTVAASTARLGTSDAIPLTFNLYPSLATDKFHLNLDFAEKTNTLITILNSKGIEIQKLEMEIGPGESPQINISQLPAETYFLKITTEDQQKTLRFIKH